MMMCSFSGGVRILILNSSHDVMCMRRRGPVRTEVSPARFAISPVWARGADGVPVLDVATPVRNRHLTFVGTRCESMTEANRMGRRPCFTRTKALQPKHAYTPTCEETRRAQFE